MSSDPVPANPKPASTVVVLRDCATGAEVFLVQRHEGTAFMGGAHVFPGGRVDAADRDADDSWCDGIAHARAQLSGVDPAEAVAYHVAAARELFEEAGVLLARDRSGRVVPLTSASDRARFRQYRRDVHANAATFRDMVTAEGLRLALDTLVLFAHWVTPPIDTRQFDTRFFMTRVPPDQTPAHDETETTHSTWMSPHAALNEALAGHIVLPPPTWTTLREIEPFATVTAALAWARTRAVARRQPQVLVEDGRRLLLLPGDPQYDGEAPREMPLESRFVFIDGRWRAERVRP